VRRSQRADPQVAHHRRRRRRLPGAGADRKQAPTGKPDPGPETVVRRSRRTG